MNSHTTRVTSIENVLEAVPQQNPPCVSHARNHEIVDFRVGTDDIHGVAAPVPDPGEAGAGGSTSVSEVGRQEMDGGKCVNGRKGIAYHLTLKRDTNKKAEGPPLW